MTYNEAIGYLYERLPVFHKIGARAYKPGLQTTRAFCEHLNNPQNSFPTIHVGGTNGKGSTSHMMASILQEAGYKVGLYTSPHLKSFNERIKVNGVEIDENFIADFITEHKSYIETLSPSFFEVTVALAFSYFENQKVDIAVIEVGMGGRMDSTNVITPILSMITNISFDHMEQLGDTLPKIAREKAGIIKSGVPVVISEQMDADVMDVFSEVSANENANLYLASSVLNTKILNTDNGIAKIEIALDKKAPFSKLLNGIPKEFSLGLAGSYQSSNIKGVLMACSLLMNNSEWNLSWDIAKRGLANVTNNTKFKGRWTILQESPFVVCDTAHNKAGLTATLSQFAKVASSAKHFVLGFVGDKDVTGILELLPKDGKYYFCQPLNPRAYPVQKLMELALATGIKGDAYSNVNLALEAALASAAPTDTVYVGGSTFVVADIDRL